jgi:hypothetical protein
MTRKNRIEHKDERIEEKGMKEKKKKKKKKKKKNGQFERSSPKTVFSFPLLPQRKKEEKAKTRCSLV